MKSIASHNGLSAAARAFERMQAGAGPLDACVEGVTLVEDDPDDLTVGYGGLPNEEGVVELDAAVMDGLTHRGAAVAALQSVRHPSRVARLLMEQTGRVMLAGAGALAFAKANGFVEEDLLTDRARRMWLYWKRRRSEHDDWKTPPADEELELEAWYRKNFYAEPGGTVHCSAIDQAGDMACCTSTSGHAFKLPGRVGDSPILGAGLYVDNDVGACGGIGCGEAAMQHCASFAVIELMRGGASPREAGLEALRRIAEKTPEADCDDKGRPKFNLQLFALAKSGQHAGVALRGSKQIAVADPSGARLEDCTPLFGDAR